MAEDRYKTMFTQVIIGVVIASIVGIGGFFSSSIFSFTHEVADNTRKQSELNSNIDKRLILLETYQSVFRQNLLQITERAGNIDSNILTLQFDVKDINNHVNNLDRITGSLAKSIKFNEEKIDNNTILILKEQDSSNNI